MENRKQLILVTRTKRVSVDIPRGMHSLALKKTLLVPVRSYRSTKHKHETFITVHGFQGRPCLLLGSKVNKAVVFDLLHALYLPKFAEDFFYGIFSRA